MQKTCYFFLILSVFAHSSYSSQASPDQSTPHAAYKSKPVDAFNPAPSNFNGFLYAVTTGVSITLISKGFSYLFDKATGISDQQISMQKDALEFKRMEIIRDFCKDPSHKIICDELMQQYLENQLALAKSK